VTRKVSICGVPYTMTIVDGGVLFSNKCGFYGVSGRFMFSRRSMLWYLDHSESTWGSVAVAHLVAMHELIAKHIAEDHEPEKDGGVFQLQWRAA
jgi:hypothetical protein